MLGLMRRAGQAVFVGAGDARVEVIIARAPGQVHMQFNGPRNVPVVRRELVYPGEGMAPAPDPTPRQARNRAILELVDQMAVLSPQQLYDSLSLLRKQ